MTPTDLLTAATTAGLALRVEAGALRVRGPQDALAAWAPMLKAHKPALVALLTTPPPRPTTAPPCESWEERAAILEHDAGLSRTDAEEQAPNRRWLIHLPDGWRDSTFTPPASMADLRRWHPAALALVPCDDEADPWGEDDPECGAIDTPSEYIFGGSEDPGAVTLH